MTFTGARLHQGFDVQLQPGVEQRYKIYPLLASAASGRGHKSTPLSVAHNSQGPVIVPVLSGFPLKGIPARSVSGPSVVLTVSGRAVSPLPVGARNLRADRPVSPSGALSMMAVNSAFIAAPLMYHPQWRHCTALLLKHCLYPVRSEAEIRPGAKEAFGIRRGLLVGMRTTS